MRIPPQANQYYRVLLPVIGMLIVAVTIRGFINPPAMPESSKNHRKPMLALEFAKTQKQVDDLAKRFDRRTLIADLKQDTLVLVPVYCGYLLILSGSLYFRRTGAAALWLVIVPLVVAFTGVTDLLENLAAYGALTNKLTAGSIYPAAAAKWAGLAITCMLIGCGFASRGKDWPAATGLLYLLGGIAIGIAALWPDPTWIDVAFVLIGLAVCFTAEAIHATRQ